MHGGALRLDLESEGENILHCYVIYWSGSEENLKKVSFLSHVFLFTLNAWEKFNIDIIWLPKSFSKTASSNLVILTFLIILKW